MRGPRAGASSRLRLGTADDLISEGLDLHAGDADGGLDEEWWPAVAEMPDHDEARL
jgi:hypothetical protein